MRTKTLQMIQYKVLFKKLNFFLCHENYVTWKSKHTDVLPEMSKTCIVYDLIIHLATAGTNSRLNQYIHFCDLI